MCTTSQTQEEFNATKWGLFSERFNEPMRTNKYVVDFDKEDGL